MDIAIFDVRVENLLDREKHETRVQAKGSYCINLPISLFNISCNCFKFSSNSFVTIIFILKL